MSSQEVVRGLLDRLPPEASLSEIAQEIEFIEGVREGLAELDRGEHVTEATLRERMREWTASK